MASAAFNQLVRDQAFSQLVTQASFRQELLNGSASELVMQSGGGGTGPSTPVH
jgi:hypothetical protein